MFEIFKSFLYQGQPPSDLFWKNSSAEANYPSLMLADSGTIYNTMRHRTVYCDFWDQLDVYGDL